MTKNRVRSLGHAIPYSIDEWTRVDFAHFYERAEDKKYNYSLEDYKKKCYELETILTDFTEKHVEIVRFREEELTYKFDLMLTEEISKAVCLKEKELVGKFSKLVEHQKTENLKGFKDLMENEIAIRVNVRIENIKHDLENKYMSTIHNQRNQITKMSLRSSREKPKKTGNVFPSRFKSECYYCNGHIREGEPICQAKFSNGIEKYVHQDCCEW